MIFGRVKPLDAILATAEKKSLHRSLGWFQLTLFGIGCVIGTGIFVLTAAGAQKAGPAGTLDPSVTLQRPAVRHSSRRATTRGSAGGTSSARSTSCIATSRMAAARTW